MHWTNKRVVHVDQLLKIDLKHLSLRVLRLAVCAHVAVSSRGGRFADLVAKLVRLARLAWLFRID